MLLQVQLLRRALAGPDIAAPAQVDAVVRAVDRLHQEVARVTVSTDGTTLDDALAARRTTELALLTVADMFVVVAEHAV